MARQGYSSFEDTSKRSAASLFPGFLEPRPLAKRDEARPLELASHARPVRTVAAAAAPSRSA